MTIKDATDEELRLLQAALLYASMTDSAFQSWAKVNNIPLPAGKFSVRDQLHLLVARVPVPQADWDKAYSD